MFAGLLVLVVVRGIASLAQGQRGEVWPFAVLLAIGTGYEAAWLVYIRRAIRSDLTIPVNGWRASLLAECIFPTAAVVLAIHTPAIGPGRALTAPVVAVYFLFIILSTLHLDSGLSRLAGVFAATGYAAAASDGFLEFSVESNLAYATAFSYVGLLLLSGFAAGAVADQIRLHVLAALRDAESRARIAQLQHDMDTARAIQQGYLPQAPPRIEGFDIAAGTNLPMRRAATTSTGNW